jgi:hypothetical protein
LRHEFGQSGRLLHRLAARERDAVKRLPPVCLHDALHHEAVFVTGDAFYVRRVQALN